MSRFNIQQIRKGFAFNSSSSHSVVFLKPGDTDVDASGRDTEDDYYGWESFILASPEAKAKYFACQFRHALAGSIGYEAATVVTAGYFGHPGLATVDHQSVMSLPRNRDGSLAIDFIRAVFNSFIQNDKIGVIGGNDNGGDELQEGRPPVNFGSSYGEVVARKEPDGTWISFDRRNGTKIRFTPDFLGKVRDRKAATPELVDIKITDFCSFGCSFCYQGSTPKGVHGSLKDFQKLIDRLAELETFEVAIGGGEPTEHPDFVEMIQYAHKKGVIPNITTRSVAWLKNKEITKAMNDCVGAVGMSCDTAEDLRTKLNKIRSSKNFYSTRKINFQFIAGVTPMEEFPGIVKIVKENWVNLSLVGFKRTGRAGEPLPLDGDALKKMLQSSLEEVSVDISFLQQYPMFDQAATCDTQEGRHSMYVDLVTKEMAKSSYCPERVPLDLEKLNDYFSSF